MSGAGRRYHRRRASDRFRYGCRQSGEYGDDERDAEHRQDASGGERRRVSVPELKQLEQHRGRRQLLGGRRTVGRCARIAQRSSDAVDRRGE